MSEETITENGLAKRSAGRYRLNEEDKAKPISLRISQRYLDRLEFIPGKNNSDKIRNIIDQQVDFVQRERRQINEIKRLIGPLYRLSKELTSPEIKEDVSKFNSKKMTFLNGIGSIEKLIDLYHFSFDTLRKGLSDRDFLEIEIVFSVKSFFNQ